MQIVYGSINSSEWPSINEIRNRNCAHEVFKCLHGLALVHLQKSFTRVFHLQNTRGNNVNLSLPKVQTEAGRKRFAYQGSIIFKGELHP